MSNKNNLLESLTDYCLCQVLHNYKVWGLQLLLWMSIILLQWSNDYWWSTNNCSRHQCIVLLVSIDKYNRWKMKIILFSWPSSRLTYLICLFLCSSKNWQEIIQSLFPLFLLSSMFFLFPKSISEKHIFLLIRLGRILSRHKNESANNNNNNRSIDQSIELVQSIRWKSFTQTDKSFGSDFLSENQKLTLMKKIFWSQRNNHNNDGRTKIS